MIEPWFGHDPSEEEPRPKININLQSANLVGNLASINYGMGTMKNFTFSDPAPFKVKIDVDGNRWGVDSMGREFRI